MHATRTSGATLTNCAIVTFNVIAGHALVRDPAVAVRSREPDVHAVQFTLTQAASVRRHATCFTSFRPRADRHHRCVMTQPTGRELGLRHVTGTTSQCWRNSTMRRRTSRARPCRSPLTAPRVRPPRVLWPAANCWAYTGTAGTVARSARNRSEPSTTPRRSPTPSRPTWSRLSRRRRRRSTARPPATRPRPSSGTFRPIRTTTRSPIASRSRPTPPSRTSWPARAAWSRPPSPRPS